MADVAPGTLETTTAATPDTGVTPTPSTSETVAAPASATADDTVSKVRKIYESMEEGPSPSAPAKTPPPAQAATTPDGTPAASQVPATPPGPIPFDRHKAVVTNTRHEARKETLSEFGIADGMSAKDVSTGLNLVRLLHENPQLFLQMVQSQLGTAATPASASAAAATPKAAADPEPEPDIPLQDGRFTRSADNLREWHQWSARQLQAQMDEKYGPIRDAHERQQLQLRAQADAKQIVGTARQWPLFNELRPHITAALKGHQGPLTATALHDAYIGAFREHGTRLQREAWERERAADVALKTSGSSARPSAAHPVTPHVGKLSTKQRVEQIWNRLETAG